MPRSFVSEKYGFTIATPKGWHMGVLTTEGLPIFVNFPLADLATRGITPKRGDAIIHIVAGHDPPRPNRDDTLDDWADSDQLGKSRNSCSILPLRMPTETQVSRAIMMACDEHADISSEPQQRDVSVYWEFRGKRFASYLNYAIGDPNAKAYERALLIILRGLRPT